jgi:hypothetical protein
VLTRFVCLANSFKEGGRCLAGVIVDEDNRPVLESGRVRWVRPVTTRDHGQLAWGSVQRCRSLDVVTIETVEGPAGENHQTENVLCVEGSIAVAGRFSRDRLDAFCDSGRTPIFGNKGKAVPKDRIGSVTRSLMMIKTDAFRVLEKRYKLITAVI